MTECLGKVKIDFSMDWAFVMRKDQEDDLEIIFHLNVQIEPTFVVTGFSEYKMDWVQDEVSI